MLVTKVLTLAIVILSFWTMLGTEPRRVGVATGYAQKATAEGRSLPLPVLYRPPAFAVVPKGKKRVARPPTRVEVKATERRLSEMGYRTGPIDGLFDEQSRAALLTFQKWEGRRLTGRLTRSEFDAVLNAPMPEPRDPGYKHVEVDLDRQVLLVTDDQGEAMRILPVSTGSGRRYNENGIRGSAYTPRGRFRIYGKLAGWRKSDLGLLFYPNYFSDGLAIHGNPSVPNQPRSHGCIRIPMSAAREISKLLPVGTILLIYDKDSFVSAREWAEADRQKQAEINFERPPN